MKYLLLVVFLFGCDTDNPANVQDNEPVDVFIKVELPEIRHNDSSRYNGDITHINDNSWVYASHINDDCTFIVSPIESLKSPCRKVNSLFHDELASDGVEKLSFEFVVAEFNIENPPYWDIIYQYWVRIRADDSNGNHPISTLKLKVFDGKLYLAHYDNSWQWDYNHPADDVWDSLHVHDENRLNGYAEIEIGLSYKIDIIIHDSGRFVFKLDSVVISDKYYQTKSKTEIGLHSWGQYWNKGYNVENDPLKRIVLRFDEFTMWALSR